MVQPFSNMAHAHMLLTFLFTCFICGCFGYTDLPPLVQTVQGAIRGSFLTTYTGEKIYSFRGIRYSEPMTGENRFTPPIPVKPWTGEYDATKDGAACPQPKPQEIGSNISEDCLFLNIYTKKVTIWGQTIDYVNGVDIQHNELFSFKNSLIGAVLTGKESVVVFFHPGGFIYFTGHSDWFGPQHIMNKDIILVTTNYRLGPTGFLSANDKLLRGNYGLKDQVAVLRWVQQNIAKFGGDPNNVTIMGYSAGSASVMMHMLSPMSRGLFHKAIAMSGSATAAWAVNRDPLFLAKELSTLVGCNQTDTAQQIYDCLINTCPVHMAIKATQIKLWKGDPLVVFAAVVEKDYGDGEERFLTDEPLELIKRGDIAPVPLIIGSTAEELTYIPFLHEPSLLREIGDHSLPGIFMYERNNTQLQKNITERLRRYLASYAINTTDVLLAFRIMVSDAIITFPVVQAARLLADKSSQPVYMYLFSYIGRYSWQTHVPDSNMTAGPFHMDDLMYLFYTSQKFPEFKATDPENVVIDILTSTWTEFAKTGVPTLPQTNVKWTPLSPQNLQYLDIDINPRMVSGTQKRSPLSQRMEVWERVFPASGNTHQIYF